MYASDLVDTALLLKIVILLALGLLGGVLPGAITITLASSILLITILLAPKFALVATLVCVFCLVLV